jgi:polysaccharide export outer membrane protein
MPVRSKGRLLARAGTLLALCVSASGCQTQWIRPFGFMRSTPENVVANTAPPPAPAPAPAQVVIASSTPAACRFSFFRRARPAVEIQTPVVAAANRQTVIEQGNSLIASSWRSIERENATPASPAEVRTAPPAVSSTELVRQIGASAVESESTDTPWRPAMVAASTAQAPAAAVPIPTTPTEPAPARLAAPQATPSTQSGVARAHYHYPSGVHGDGAAPPAIPAVPREFEKQSLPPYVVEPPDILLINASNAITLPTQPLLGQHLVRPDGTLNLGIYGSIFVAGMTLDQVADAVAGVLKARHARRKTEDGKPAEKEMTLEEIRLELQVDVLAYNSKVYYIITDGGGYGEQVYRISATGNETVLDALSQINGLPAVASKKRIWVARATPDHAPPQILPVDWCGIVRNGSAATNYQIFPGDRIYVNSDARIRTDSALGKFLAPVERVLGTVLLGSSTVNSIKNGGTGNGTGSGVP